MQPHQLVAKANIHLLGRQLGHTVCAIVVLEAIQRLLRDFPGPDFILAAGDDRTDEDLFERAPSNAWTVHIGPGPTRASFVVPDLPVLRGVLESLATAGAAGRRPATPVDHEPDSPAHDRWRRRLRLL